MLRKRRVGLFELFDQRPDLIAEGLEAGPAWGDFDAGPLAGRLNLYLELVNRLGDSPRPQKPYEQAREGAGDAGPDENVREPGHTPFGVGQRPFGILTCKLPELVKQVPQTLGAHVIAVEHLPRFVDLLGIVEADRSLPAPVVRRVFTPYVVEQLPRRGVDDVLVRARQPRFERRPAGFELREPGAVAAQQVFGDEALLVLKSRHRRGVVDQRQLLRNGHPGHRGAVLERGEADAADDADGDRGADGRERQTRGQRGSTKPGRVRHVNVLS